MKGRLLEAVRYLRLTIQGTLGSQCCRFAQQEINDEALDLLAIKEREKNRTDKCDHCFKRG